MPNNFTNRAVTGIIFVCFIIGALYFGEWTFLALFSIITAASLAEFYSIINKYQRTSIKIPFHAAGGTIGLILTSSYWAGYRGSEVTIFYLAYLLLIFITQLYNQKADNPLKNWAFITLGHIYITLPFCLLSLLTFYRGTFSPELALGLFIVIWLNDTGAFLVGSRFGRRRLFERISPKKSWEGFWGGFVTAMLGGLGLSFCFSSLSTLEWVAFGAIASCFATWGDLAESLLKRTVGIKDSGSILPGHGGVLDRFDSLLLATPATLIYLMLLEYF